MVLVAAKFHKVQLEVAKLMAYGVLINQAAREHTLDRWLTYDCKFQELVGVKDDTWNELNVCLWNHCFTSQTKWLSQKACSECQEEGHNALPIGQDGGKKETGSTEWSGSEVPVLFPFQ